MSDQYTLITKELRSGFTAKIHYDQYLGPEDSPRAQGDNLTKIYFWNTLTHLSDSKDVGSYHKALYQLYQKTYPALAEYLLEDEPPPEIMSLIKQTPYPGVLKWINVRDHQEIEITTTDLSDPDDRYLSGVAFICDEDLEKEGFTHEEGTVLIENDMVMLEQYANGKIFLLQVSIDGETQYIGEIYALEKAGEVGRLVRHKDAYLPAEEQLDEYLMEMAQSDEDEELIRTTEWK